MATTTTTTTIQEQQAHSPSDLVGRFFFESLGEDILELERPELTGVAVVIAGAAIWAVT